MQYGSILSSIDFAEGSKLARIHCDIIKQPSQSRLSFFAVLFPDATMLSNMRSLCHSLPEVWIGLPKPTYCYLWAVFWAFQNFLTHFNDDQSCGVGAWVEDTYPFIKWDPIRMWWGKVIQTSVPALKTDLDNYNIIIINLKTTRQIISSWT